MTVHGWKHTTVSGSHLACRSQAGGFFASGRGDPRNALHVCFQDAAPDSWGRALMTRVLGGGLTEFDYLTQSGDRTRHGALRFLDDELVPLSRLSPPVPRLVELERLRTLAHQFERDPEGAEEAVRDLAGVAGSLGGARPKASVEGTENCGSRNSPRATIGAPWSAPRSPRYGLLQSVACAFRKLALNSFEAIALWR